MFLILLIYVQRFLTPLKFMTKRKQSESEYVNNSLINKKKKKQKGPKD